MAARQDRSGLQGSLRSLQDDIDKGDETVIEALLDALAPYMGTKPWLFLAIEGITYERYAWIARLSGTLSQIKVMPIFMTSDTHVVTLFRANGPDPKLTHR